MKRIIKRFIRLIAPSFLQDAIGFYGMAYSKNRRIGRIQTIMRCTVIYPNKKSFYQDDYAFQFARVVGKMNINVKNEYLYPYDTLVYRGCLRTGICSITMDYGKVLESDIHELKDRLKLCKDEDFKNRELSILSSIELLSHRYLEKLIKARTKRAKELISFISKMLYRDPESFDEALQKILFYNALFWQMNHYHIGLGRLDVILNKYYERDVRNQVITKETAKKMLRSFILTLGKDIEAKSPLLRGDTGQYILLGGIDKRGNTVDNDLTHLFIEIFSELKIPDPKLILRINSSTSKRVLDESINCLKTGIGSPLFMDENTIMHKMIDFGYDCGDVWNVGTSACWEPLVIGKSFDQNNPFRSIIAVKSLNDVITSGAYYSSFDQLLDSYKEKLKYEIKGIVSNIRFDCSPLFTLFADDCLNREKDFTDGGAIYSYHGVQIVSFPNLINSLLNIKRLVFEEKLFSLDDCKRAISTNFLGMEDFQRLLLQGKKFGSTDAGVIKLTNDIIHYTSSVVADLRCNGNRIKFGLSSPNYIVESQNMPATLDGRKFGEPFAVHISPISSKIDFSEVLDFSTQLEYDSNCINGNVVDFILPSSYIRLPEKLAGIIENACSHGFFELQLNVMDKATLIDAKAHPEKYPNLVVRVWGFSAYFNDLPEEYKDNLIRRAELYEAA